MTGAKVSQLLSFLYAFTFIPQFSIADLLSNAFGPLPPTPCYGFLYAESDCRKECQSTEKCQKYVAYADHREHLNEIYNCYNCVVAPWLISTAVLVPVAFIIIVIVVCCVICRRRKRQKKQKTIPTVQEETTIVSSIPQTVFMPQYQVETKPQNLYVTQQQPYNGYMVQHVIQQPQSAYLYQQPAAVVQQSPQRISPPKVVPLTKETLKQHEVLYQRLGKT